MNNTWTIAPTSWDGVYVLQNNGKTVVQFMEEDLDAFIDLIAVYKAAQREFPNTFTNKTPISNENNHSDPAAADSGPY